MDALAAKLATGMIGSRCPLNFRSVICMLEYLQAMRVLTTSPATRNYTFYAYPVAVMDIPPACGTQINHRPLAARVTGPASRGNRCMFHKSVGAESQDGLAAQTLIRR
jgi:hypothetical protein